MIDKSNKYIKMCMKADYLLRDLYTFKEGDFLYCLNTREIKVLSSKVIAIQNNQNHLRLAIPRRMTIAKPISECELPDSLNVSIDYIYFDLYPEQYWFRLHRQDQLLSFLGDYYHTREFLIDHLNHANIDFRYDSWEQVWLSVIMKEKFNMYWCEYEHYAHDWSELK